MRKHNNFTAFGTVQHETETLNYVFQDVTSTCVQGSLRYQRLGTALLSQEFMEKVCALPEVYDETKYIAFIDTWGTVIYYCIYNYLYLSFNKIYVETVWKGSSMVFL